MRKNKGNRYLIVGASLTLLLIGAWYFTYFALGSKSAEEKTGYVSAPGSGNSEEVADDLRKLFPDDMSEYRIQNAIHHMSHQKIKSDKKWGAIQITDQRIDRLIEVIERNDYQNEFLYLDILNNWKQGDFSEADREHNQIWRLQGGTVGEAKGLLTAKEEKEFIKKHFR